MNSPSPPPVAIKRKRDPVQAEELEIDVDAPEPPSKRAQRLAKKGKTLPAKPKSPSPVPERRKATVAAKGDYGEANSPDNHREQGREPSPTGQDRSRDSSDGFGVWIGNLNWTTDKASLRTFLTERGTVSETAIKRIHMPTPSKASASALKRPKPAKNKGFAYVDFTSAEAQAQAMALSETLIDGRKLLIKDARDFDGRPPGHASNAANGNDAELYMKSGNPPNKRVFIGNLHFETDRDGLREHFEQCGDVEQTFVATFEDSGKCKGYAWVTFADLEGAKAAVRGWIKNEKVEYVGDQSGEVMHDVKPPPRGKSHKRWINVLLDRRLRVEFAEDPTVRYQKRFGRGKNNDEGAEGA